MLIKEKKIKNDLTRRYDKSVIWVHWLSFLLIAALVPTGKILREYPEAVDRFLFYQIHVCVGILVFVMTLYRSYLYFSKPRPPRLNTGLAWHNQFIVWVQRLFYGALLVLGVTGLIVIFTNGIAQALLQNNRSLLPAKVDSEVFEIHETMGNLLIVLFFAHILGVLIHYLRHKENVLKRIF